jgi:O-antigen ligase
MENLKTKYQDYHPYFLMVFLFLLPFAVLHNIILVVWLLTFILFGNPLNAYRQNFKEIWHFIPIIIFAIYVLYYFFSKNTFEAAQSIERKLGLLLFPLLIWTHRYSSKEIRKILFVFVLACIITSLICICNALYKYFIDGVAHFFYMEFSIFLHPSYAAMYAILAIAIIAIDLFYNQQSRTTRLIYTIILLFLTISILLYSSKMGLLSFSILMPLFTFLVLIKRKAYKTIVLLVMSFLVFMPIAYKLVPKPFERIKTALTVTASYQTVDQGTSESTGVRILIWKKAITKIKENLWLGVSPGDADDKLLEAYAEGQMDGANQKKLNAHNEFLQITLGLGILGLFAYIMLFIIGFYQAFLYKNRLLNIFLVLIILNFLVESMLQRQAGILFFACFLCLFLHQDFKFEYQKNRVS